MVIDRPENSKPIRCITINKYRKNADIKSLNYIESVLAKIKALEAGVDDAILMDESGITEATTENIFIVKDGKLYTPKYNILKGITRKVVMENFKVKEEMVYTYEWMDANEIFLTGTGAGITPVIEINGIKKSIGPITKEVMKKYNELKLQGEPLL